MRETMNYLSISSGMAPEDDYPVDRSKSIFELIDERNSEFENLKNLSEPQKVSFS